MTQSASLSLRSRKKLGTKRNGRPSGRPFAWGPAPKFYSDPLNPSDTRTDYQARRLNAMTELMEVGTGEASDAGSLRRDGGQTARPVRTRHSHRRCR